MGGSAKSGNTGSRNYYGTCAGIICLGQLDFIWGILVNNTLAYPANVHAWDSKLYQAGSHVIWTDGNVYKALANTWVVPPGAPWTLYAVPYVAGTWAAGSVVLNGGYVWKTAAINNLAPPATIPAAALKGTLYNYRVNYTVNGWTYVSTPQNYVGTNNWPANSIVSWDGRIYQTSANTQVQPPGAPWSLWKVDRGSSPNPLKVTVPNMGDIYLYWGTSTQTLDAVNEGTLTALGHPPYRNRAVIVLKNFLFGTETTTPPDVKVLGGRSPVQSLIAGASTNIDADWQVNPWCALAEVLTHPVFGLGLPNTMLDATSWQAEADRCGANPSLFYISPLWTSQTKARDIVAEILSYVDGWVRWDGGKLIAGHWPHGENAPAFTATNTVNRDNLIDEPNWSSKGWGDTTNSIELSFRDIQAAFKSRPALASNLFNRQATGLMLSQKVDRPHIVRYPQAAAWATEAAKLGGDRVAQGTSKVRAETTNIKPGDLFLLTDDVLGTSTVQRCTQRVIAAPPEGAVTLTHETERGVAPQAYAPSPTNPTASPGIKPAALTNFQVFQVPYDLCGIKDAVAAIASRGDTYERGFDLYVRLQDGVSWQKLGTQNGFGVIGKCRLGGYQAPTQTIAGANQGTVYNLNESRIYYMWRLYYDLPTDPPFTDRLAVRGTDYVVDLEKGTITTLPGGAVVNGSTLYVEWLEGYDIDFQDGTQLDDIEAISDTLTLDEIDDSKYLVVIFHGNPSSQFPYEICSLKSLTVAGDGWPHYYINIYGQRFNTKVGGDGTSIFSQGDYFYIIPRAALSAFTHQSFPSSFDSGDTLHLRLAPFNPWNESDDTDVWDPASNPTGSTTETTLQLVSGFNPTAGWDSIQAYTGGAWGNVNFATAYATATKFRVQFHWNSANTSVATAALVASLGDRQWVLWSTPVDSSTPPSRTVDFTLPGAGLWDVALVLTDDAGNSSRTSLQSAGSTVYINSYDAATAPTPILASGWVNQSGFITGAQVGPMAAGVAVYYTIVNRGAFPAGYTAAAAAGGGMFNLPVFGASQVVYAYCTLAGSANSDIVHWFFD